MFKIEIPLPTLAEQTKIANFLSAIDEKISNCAERLEKMEVWKKGLLQQMFV
jgi:type I restriction enzyme S subunit